MLSGSLPTEYELFIVDMESRDVLLPLESLKEKLFEEEARQSDWSEKINADNNVLLSRNRIDRKQSKASGSARRKEKVKVKISVANAFIVEKMAT